MSDPFETMASSSKEFGRMIGTAYKNVIEAAVEQGMPEALARQLSMMMLIRAVGNLDLQNNASDIESKFLDWINGQGLG